MRAVHTPAGVQGSIAFLGVFRGAVYRVSIAEVMVFSFVMSIGGGWSERWLGGRGRGNREAALRDHSCGSRFKLWTYTSFRIDACFSKSLWMKGVRPVCSILAIPKTPTTINTSRVLGNTALQLITMTVQFYCWRM